MTDDNANRVTFRELDWGALVRQAEGKNFDKPMPVYHFTGRTFEDNPRGGPYEASDD